MENYTLAGAVLLLALLALFLPEEVGQSAGKIVSAFNAEVSSQQTQ